MAAGYPVKINSGEYEVPVVKIFHITIQEN